MSRTTLEVPADDAISLTLSKFNPNDLVNVIEGLKRVTDQDPAQARAMLESNPDLTYAVLQAEFLMGLIDEEVVSEAMNLSGVSTSANESAIPAAQTVVTEPAPEPPAAPMPVQAANGSETSTETADPFSSLPPEQAAMIRQVVAISEEQLALLPAEQQQQVRALKEQFGL